MTTAAQLRNRYASDTVGTASPGRLVVMLYDRLLRDLTTAERAVGVRDVPVAHSALVHAQDIVRELNSAVDTSVWREAAQLKELYTWCLEQLVSANTSKDVVHVRNAREVLEPLGDAWSQAANAS